MLSIGKVAILWIVYWELCSLKLDKVCYLQRVDSFKTKPFIISSKTLDPQIRLLQVKLQRKNTMNIKRDHQYYSYVYTCVNRITKCKYTWTDCSHTRPDATLAATCILVVNNIYTCGPSLLCNSSRSTSSVSLVILRFWSLHLKCLLVFLLSMKLANILQSECSVLHFCTNVFRDLSSASRVRQSKWEVTRPCHVPDTRYMYMTN